MRKSLKEKEDVHFSINIVEMAKLIANVYPQHNWMPWKFKRVTKGFWEDLSNQRLFMDYIGKQLEVKTFQDWYSVKVIDVLKKGGRSLLDRYERKSFQSFGKHISRI